MKYLYLIQDSHGSESSSCSLGAPLHKACLCPNMRVHGLFHSGPGDPQRAVGMPVPVLCTQVSAQGFVHRRCLENVERIHECLQWLKYLLSILLGSWSGWRIEVLREALFLSTNTQKCWIEYNHLNESRVKVKNKKVRCPACVGSRRCS